MTTPTPSWPTMWHSSGWSLHLPDEGVQSAVAYHGLFLYYATIADGITYAVELGSQYGWSACWIAGAMRDRGLAGLVHCVDHFNEGGVEYQAKWEQNLTRWGVAQWVVPHRGDILEILPTLPGGIQLAFIDSWHSRAHLQKELELLCPKLAECSLLCLHDTFNPEFPQYVNFAQFELEQFFPFEGRLDFQEASGFTILSRGHRLRERVSPGPNCVIGD